MNEKTASQEEDVQKECHQYQEQGQEHKRLPINICRINQLVGEEERGGGEDERGVGEDERRTEDYS